MKPDVCGRGDGAQDLQKRILECCEKLSVLNKCDSISRRNMLNEVRIILSTNEESLLQEPDLDTKLDKLVTLLVPALLDESEKCREICATLLNHIFQSLCIVESALPELFKILASRLTKSDEREQSEEVRLVEVHLLHHVIEKYDGDLLQHLTDISTIISSCIIDDCPDIKKKSCLCLSLLASKQNSHFHMVGSTFLKSLLSTITHQHLRTRALCVDALVAIVDYLNHEEFKEAISSLAQRLFDRSPLVRTAVTRGVGKMLISLKDRYSYFHYLIPLALSSLYDEVEEIRSLAQDVWYDAGNQYLEENDNDYKDVITDSRSKLGCHLLIQRNIFNILPALLNDLTDWSAEARVKSSKVLFSLILHSEEKITISLPSVLEGIITAAKDEQRVVIDEALKSAELLGKFVDPNLLVDNILKLTYSNPTAMHLSILAASLRGHEGLLPMECFLALCKFLADPTVSRLRQADEQANLLLCIEGLLATGNEITTDTSYNLFTMLASISGLTLHESISKKADDLLKHLAELQSSSEMSLFKQHAVPLLKVLCENNELWTSQSPEVHIFSFIVESGCFDEEMIDVIIPVLINSLHPSKDAKIRSKVMSLLIPVFEKLSPSENELFSGKITQLIRLGLFPNLTWSAGKTASSLRTVATASLYEIMNKSSLKTDVLKSIGAELLPILETLLDDDAASTRLLSCKILEIILPQLKDCVDELKVHKTCHEILHCMDDQSDEIRLMTIRVLKAYIKSFPVDYDWSIYRSYLKHMFENVLIHMDDRNEKIKTAVLDFLKEVGFAAPDVLLQEIDSKKYMMSSSNLCDDLMKHIQNIKL